MIQLQKSREIIDSDDLGRLKTAFARENCVFLPKLLDAAILKFLVPHLERQIWIQRSHEGIGSDDILCDGAAVRLLHFVTNTPGFLEAVREISGCKDLTLFQGNVYRLIPDSDHYDSWHDDVKENSDRRLVGMSLNLGSRDYEGGVFQLREEDSKRIIFEIANTGWGDATLFRLSSRFKHRVTAVTGKEPRVAFAGWFRADTADFLASLRHTAAQN